MRVLLVVPTHDYRNTYPSFLSVSDFPSGYAYLASSLREAGHKVFGLNLNNITGYASAYSMIRDRITKALKETHPDLIGIGGLCIDYRFIRDAALIIREVSPKTPIVLGGGIVTHDAEYIFNLLKPDFCIIGEGEEAMVQLADMIDGGRDYSKVDNLGYWENGKAVFTQANYDYPDINQRPFPDYEPFGIRDMLDNYSMATRLLYSYTRPNARPMIIVTARGCPFNCTFCIHQRGPRYRARSIENIMEELAVMYDRYKFNILIISDELFAVNKQRMRDFCTALIEARRDKGWDFDWLFQTHSNARLDYETLKLAKEAGCYFFAYGMESASPTVLKSMNKKSNPLQYIEAIELANSLGIGFGGNLLFFDPAETSETIQETMEFFLRYCLDQSVFIIFVEPYPGSKIFEDSLKRGIIRDKFEYYEKIGEQVWNMTSMPHEIWARWANFLATFSNSYLWIKSTTATRWEEEADSTKSPMVAYSGRLIRKVWAECPHCGKGVHYRWMLGGERPVSLFAPICTQCNKAIRIKIPALNTC